MNLEPRLWATVFRVGSESFTDLFLRGSPQWILQFSYCQQASTYFGILMQNLVHLLTASACVFQSDNNLPWILACVRFQAINKLSTIQHPLLLVSCPCFGTSEIFTMFCLGKICFFPSPPIRPLWIPIRGSCKKLLSFRRGTNGGINRDGQKLSSDLPLSANC